MSTSGMHRRPFEGRHLVLLEGDGYFTDGHIFLPLLPPRVRVLSHYLLRARLTLLLLERLDLINRTSELARLFGIEFFDVLARGTQVSSFVMPLSLSLASFVMPCQNFSPFGVTVSLSFGVTVCGSNWLSVPHLKASRTLWK